jgi:hypothetical protein
VANVRTIEHPDRLGDDYLVETGAEPARPPVLLQIVRLLQVILFLAIAALSFAIFWMVGLILGIF